MMKQHTNDYFHWWLSIPFQQTVFMVTFRLEYENDCEYEFKLLSTRTSKIFALQA